MTKEIIDKSLNELSNYWIDTIRLTGGEPSLVPELIEYIINGIIKRKIIVNTIHLPNNGTITNDKIKKSIIKFLDYSDTIQSNRKKILHFFNKKYKPSYPSLKGKNPAWITHLSTWEHKNKDTFDKVKEFYTINDSRYAIITQEEISNREDLGTIDIEGKAIKNYSLYSKNQLNFIRIPFNEFCIIEDDAEKEPFLQKTLTISANGKVYVGGTKSFDNIEKDYLFNIMGCHNDFWEKVDKWCWCHPISIQARNFIEEYKSLQWKYEHHINMELNNINVLKSFKKMVNMIEVYRENLILFHSKLPYLSHSELNLFVVAYLCQEIYKTYGESKETINILNMFIEHTTGLQDELNKWDKELVENIYNLLIKRNNDRAISKINNPIKKFFATLYANT